MTTLTIDKLSIPVTELGPECAVPSIFKSKNVQQMSENRLDEDDGLYVGYGYIDDPFPYRKQNRYDGTLRDTELPCVILENEYLKTLFLPTLGGRLWQLYDKKAKRDLMVTNTQIAFGNLAIRDAWFCGGVEWNFGIIGHTPFTCDTLHTATLKTDDGTPVLRFYEYERLRGCTYQVDAWLPEGSPRLYVGVRLVNPTQEVKPTYWWSNVAVAEDPGARVIYPATQAYTNHNRCISKVSQFKTEERDITYPTQLPYAVDYFWRVKDAEHKFMTQIGQDGYGLVQSATSRQQGRKLFVWGQHTGAKNWQNTLKTTHYVEIQAGLGQTQYEHIPMPPNTAWSWVESYGAIQVDPRRAHGEWADAIACVSEQVSQYGLEEVLKNATHMTRPADEVIIRGSGWGALEELLREGQPIRALSKHLDFGQLQAPQQDWVRLVREGTLGQHDPADEPISWMYSDRVTALLEQAIADKDKDNWYTYLHLGVIYHVDKKPEKAVALLNRSIDLCDNPWAHYALACIAWRLEQKEEAITQAVTAIRMRRFDPSFVRSALDILIAANRNDLLIQELKDCPENVLDDIHIRAVHAVAQLEFGNWKLAWNLLDGDVDKLAPYVREGATNITDFWIQVETARRQEAGLDASNVENEVPVEWDFRMH